MEIDSNSIIRDTFHNHQIHLFTRNICKLILARERKKTDLLHVRSDVVIADIIIKPINWSISSYTSNKGSSLFFFKSG